MTFAAISERRVGLVIRLAEKNGRPRSYGRVSLVSDGETVTATRRGSTIASGTIVEQSQVGETWRITTSNGDVWVTKAGCGCGG